jgi:dihydrofolate reductase
MMRMALIVAVSENGVIGRGGTLPWRIPEDMRWFKEKTLGKPCIMGRKTWESFPKRPLPGRPNIVITRDRSFAADGATVVHSFDEAVRAAERVKGDGQEIMVLGGAEIYRDALPRADRIYLTRVHTTVDGDTYLPNLDPAMWHEVSAVPARDAAPHRATFTILDRLRE